MKLLEFYLFLLQEKQWEGEDDVGKSDLDIIRRAIQTLGGEEEDLNKKRHDIQPTLMGLISTAGGDYKGRSDSSNSKRDPRSGLDILKKYLPNNWKEILKKHKISVQHDQEDLNMEIDKYLQEIQLEESKAGWIAFGILAAAIGVISGLDYRQGKKAEALLLKHKNEVNKIVGRWLKDATIKISKLGMALHRLLTVKYPHVIRYWPNKDNIQNLKDPKKYPEFIVKEVNSALKVLVKTKHTAMRSQMGYGFFSNTMYIQPANDDVGDMLWNEPKFQAHPDSLDPESNPEFKRWNKDYMKALNEIDRADAAVRPYFEAVVNKILMSLKQYIEREM